MAKTCVITDFDGTITEKDTLYTFFKTYASDGWKDVEQMWVSGLIGSKECLIKEFNLVPNLNKKLVDDFIKTVKIDRYFKDFVKKLNKQNIKIFVVSDGVDYFIENVFKTCDIKGISVVANHGTFSDNEFSLTFPNENSNCIKNSGTCKCKILESFKAEYDKIIYIGDGVSDFCVADKSDILFAKSKLVEYCKNNGIAHIDFENFKNISEHEMFSAS